MSSGSRWLQLALAIILLAAVVKLPGQVAELRANWAIFRQWDEPAEQYRQQMGGEVYDTLRAADRLLPADRPVLLVTDGRDVRHFEYTAYHRALYFLTPRLVWWLSPAPPDGTWESRWWISAPLTVESVRTVAAEKGADCVLLLGEGRGLGELVETLPGGSLRQVSGETGACGRERAVLLQSQANLDEIWPVQMGIAMMLIMAFGYFLVGVTFYPAGRMEAVALAWLLGAGGFSVLLFYLDRFGLSWSSQVAVLSGLAGLGPLWHLRKIWEGELGGTRGNSGELKKPTKVVTTNESLALFPRLLVSLSLLLLAFYILYVMLLATGRPFTVWDSWVNWGMKARTIWLEGGITPAVYADPSRAVTLQDYPLSVPLLESWIFGWLNAADERLAAVIFPSTYLAFIVVFYRAVRRQELPRHLALLVVIAAAQPLAGLFAGAYTDAILAAYAAVAAVYLLEWLNKGTAGVLLVGAVAAGLLPWIKREGLLLLVALVAALLLVGVLRSNVAGFRKPATIWGWPDKRTRRALGALLVATVVLAGPWWLFTAAHGVRNDAFLPMTPATLWANSGRLPVIVYFELRNLLHLRWNFVWSLLLVVGWVERRNGLLGDGQSLFLLITPLLYIGVMSFLYLFSDFVPYQQHIVSSDFRLVGHVLALPVLWLVSRREGEAARRQDQGESQTPLRAARPYKSPATLRTKRGNGIE